MMKYKHVRGDAGPAWNERQFEIYPKFAAIGQQHLRYFFAQNFQQQVALRPDTVETAKHPLRLAAKDR